MRTITLHSAQRRARRLHHAPAPTPWRATILALLGLVAASCATPSPTNAAAAGPPTHEAQAAVDTSNSDSMAPLHSSRPASAATSEADRSPSERTSPSPAGAEHSRPAKQHSDRASGNGTVGPATTNAVLDHTISWPHEQLTPPTGTPRVIPATNAVDALAGMVGSDVARDYGQPSVALYTNTARGKIAENGTVTPTLSDRLVWAFVHESTWKAGDGANMGGMNVGEKHATPSLRPGTPCIAVALVDAKTGTFLTGSDYCGNDLHG